MRQHVCDALQVAGAGLISLAAWMFNPVLGVLAAGVSLVVVGVVAAATAPVDGDDD